MYFTILSDLKKIISSELKEKVNWLSLTLLFV